MSNIVLSTALKWLEAGIPPLPIRPGTKKPMVSWTPYMTELPSPVEVQRWFSARPRLGLAVVCGWQHLLVLDFDRMEAYLRWETEALAAGGLAAEVAACTYRVKTSRGIHLYLYAEDPASLNVGWPIGWPVPSTHCLPTKKGASPKAPCLVEARGKDHYTAVPPTIHPSGVRYQPVNPSAPVVHVPSALELFQAYLPPAPPLPPTPRLAQPSVDSSRSGSLIAQLKTAFSVVDMAHEVGVRDLKSSDRGQGKWYLGLCPFHDDHEPSFWANAERQRVGCHSPHCALNRSGDVVDLFALHNNFTNLEAVAALARRL